MLELFLTFQFYYIAADIVECFIKERDIQSVMNLYRFSWQMHQVVIDRLKLVPKEDQFWYQFEREYASIMDAVDEEFFDQIGYVIDYMIEECAVHKVGHIYSVNRNSVVERLKKLDARHRFWIHFSFSPCITSYTPRNSSFPICSSPIDKEFIHEFKHKLCWDTNGLNVLVFLHFNLDAYSLEPYTDWAAFNRMCCHFQECLKFDFVDAYKEKIDWGACSCIGVDFTEEQVSRFASYYISFNCLIERWAKSGRVCSFEFIERHNHKINLDMLLSFKPYQTIEYIDRFYERLDKDRIASLKFDFLDAYKNKIG